MKLKFTKKHLVISLVVFLFLILFLFFYKLTTNRKERFNIKKWFNRKVVQPAQRVFVPPFARPVAAGVAAVNTAVDNFRTAARLMKQNGQDKVTRQDPNSPQDRSKTITFTFTEDQLYSLLRKYNNDINTVANQLANHINWTTNPPTFIP